MATDVGSIFSRIQIRDLEKSLEQLQQLEEQVKRIDGKTVSLKVDAGGLSAAQKQMGGFWRSMQQMGRGIQQMKRGAKQVFSGIGAPIKDAIGWFNKGRNAVLRFSDQITHVGQIAAATAFRLQLLLAPVQLFTGLVGKTTVELAHGLEVVGTQTNLTGKQLDEFLDSAKTKMQDVSVAWAVSQEDLQQALFHLISSFEIAPEAATGLLDIIGKFAVVGDTSAESIAELGVMLISTFAPDKLDKPKELAESLNTMLSQVFLAMKEGRGTFDEFVGQLGDFLRIGQQVGAGLPDILSLFTVLTRTRPLSEAATQVKRLMQSLIEEKTLEGLHDAGVATTDWAEGQKDLGYWTERAVGLSKKQSKEVEKLSGKGTGSLLSLRSKLEESELRLAKARKRGDPAAIKTQERLVRERRAALEAGEALMSLAGATEKVFVHTGKKIRRKPLEILGDFFAKVKELKKTDVEAALTLVEEAFPNIRAELGALEFGVFAEDILKMADAWDPAKKSFQDAAKTIDESADRVNETIRNKVVRGFNALINIGQDIKGDFSDRIKGALDVAIESLVGLRESVDPTTRQRLAQMLFILSALPPALLLVSVAIMGAGGLVSAIATLASPAILGTALLLFQGFRDELGKLGDVLGGYNLTTLDGIASLIGDLSVAMGALDADKANSIFKQLGLTAQVDPTKVQNLASAIGDITTKIQSGIDYVERWVDAFKEFFDMVGKREGVVGTILGQLERVAGAVLPKGATGVLEPNANTIDKIIGAILGYQIGKAALSVVMGVKTIFAGAIVVAGGAKGLLFGAGERGAETGAGGLLGLLGPAGIAMLGNLVISEAGRRMNIAAGIAPETMAVPEAFQQFDQQAIDAMNLAATGIESGGEVFTKAMFTASDSASLLSEALTATATNMTSYGETVARQLSDRFNAFALQARMTEPGIQADIARWSAIAGQATPQQMMYLAGRGGPTLPASGRGESYFMPALEQLNIVLQRIATDGVKVNQSDVEALVSEFYGQDTTPERQQEIVDKLQEIVDSSKRQESQLRSFTEALSRGFQAWSARYTAMARSYTPRHTGGYVRTLQNEFVASPLTTRLLEGVMGGALTQGSLRQLAFAAAMPQQVNHTLTLNGALGVNVQATGMDNFSLSPQQKEKLSWEITGFAVKKIREAFERD